MPLQTRKSGNRDLRLIFIAFEGTESGAECKYFRRLQESPMFQRPVLRIRIIHLPTGDQGDSAPEHVLARLKSEAARKGLNKEIDRMWMVIDTDMWGPGKLSHVVKEATECGCSVAISNPCFELWEILHHEEVVDDDFADCAEGERSKWCKQRVGKIRAQRGGQVDFELIGDAERRARELDRGKVRLPPFPSTRVYQLIEDLRSLHILG